MLTHPLIICCYDAIAVWYTFNLHDFLPMMPINPKWIIIPQCFQNSCICVVS